MNAPNLTGPHTSTDEHAEEGTELGAIRIHQNVMATIARLAATAVPGVVSLTGGIVDGLAGMISGRGTERGVRIELNDDGVRVEVAAVLEYGVRIPQVAWQIQSDVRQAVEEMTGKPVVSVDVVVQGVQSADQEVEDGPTPTNPSPEQEEDQES